ncbi:hypothetical protein HNV11_22330 [Spirosoma taeanense]|uniref:Lipocalin-like domain-containing protein n=1 Tax=Spirosoma taeanense TaxID=2735870 RepID=A0A6M5YE88_9BACT|nr:hypothetical protein [Spirosoma taeanense]QJW91924.1 hypothetical protein HNV11_22330 [Spirosoma taeanense]
MRKTHYIAFLSITTFLAVLSGCSKPKPVPISERIAKVWTARTVDENTATVYTRGATANVRNYSSFKLDLSAPPTVKYTEFDGNTFVGQYSVPSDTRLVLTNLNPSPTGANGSIEFTINSISDNELVLTRTSQSQKTGNSTNKYTLSNP